MTLLYISFEEEKGHRRQKIYYKVYNSVHKIIVFHVIMTHNCLLLVCRRFLEYYGNYFTYMLIYIEKALKKQLLHTLHIHSIYM